MGRGGPWRRRDEEPDVCDCETRKQGVNGETVLQVALVVLFVLLAALAWASMADAIAFSG